MTAPDPFAGTDSAPSISFKNAPVGTVYSMIADGPAKSLQQTVFGSEGVKDFWLNKDGSRGNPKMAAVVSGTAIGAVATKDGPTDDGDPVSLWAAIPGDLCSKINAAQKTVGKGFRIDAGTRIDVKIVAREEVGKGSPKSVYAVKLTPPAAPTVAPAVDPFGEEPPF